MEAVQLRRKIRVLAADDDHDDQLVLKEVFERIGHEIEFVDSGPLLVEKLDANTDKFMLPDIIMLDLFMPPYHGIDTLRNLKNSVDWRHIPIIIYSNYQDPEIIESAYELGATSFMPKQSNFDDMVETMQGFLNYWEKTVSLQARFE
ncbi:MAG: response regulator [Cohaesibacteraceae bacterium]|nr:response regulator [Cohaesibacteraceae bacterium]